MSVAGKYNSEISEFTVALQVNTVEGGLPYQEWFVEFGIAPTHTDTFAAEVVIAPQQKNIYFKNLIDGSILCKLVMRNLPRNTYIFIT